MNFFFLFYTPPPPTHEPGKEVNTGCSLPFLLSVTTTYNLFIPSPPLYHANLVNIFSLLAGALDLTFLYKMFLCLFVGLLTLHSNTTLNVYFNCNTTLKCIFQIPFSTVENVCIQDCQMDLLLRIQCY